MRNKRICSCGHYQHHSHGGGCYTCLCRRYRPFNGMTLRELAAKTCIDPSLLSRFFHGERRLSPEMFRKVANALGVSAEQLLVEVESNGGTP